MIDFSSEDELICNVLENIEAWIVEEMEQNPDNIDVSLEQRREETFNSFIENLTEEFNQRSV